MLSFLREGWSPAESRPEACRLVRPGAAPERGTAVPPLSGSSSACLTRIRVVPRKAGLSSQNVGAEGLFYIAK